MFIELKFGVKPGSILIPQCDNDKNEIRFMLLTCGSEGTKKLTIAGPLAIMCQHTHLALACVKMCDLRFVD